MRDYKKDDLYPHTKKLSSTQILDYAKNPSDFYQKWVLGFNDMNSPALHAGIAFSELYADRNFNYQAYCFEHKVPKRLIETIGRAVGYFQKPRNAEYELLVDYKGWKFRITFDDFCPEAKTITENKTSALLWTQETVETHAQITLQAWGYWKKFDELSKHIVNWVDTASNPKKLITTFITKRTKTQLMAFEQEVIDKVLANLELGNFDKPLF